MQECWKVPPVSTILLAYAGFCVSPPMLVLEFMEVRTKPTPSTFPSSLLHACGKGTFSHVMQCV